MRANGLMPSQAEVTFEDFGVKTLQEFDALVPDTFESALDSHAVAAGNVKVLFATYAIYENPNCSYEKVPLIGY